MAEQWSQKDSLRTMTTKFNTAVVEIEEIKQNAEQVHQATNQQISTLETSVGQQFSAVDTELAKKLESVTTTDLGLQNVNNTSDTDKPVSTAQAAAIQTAKTEAMAEQLTSEEETLVEQSPEPQISPVIDAFIRQIVQSIAAQEGITSYGVATDLVLGVVMASDDVHVAANGKMSVPELSKIAQIQASLSSLIQDYSLKQLQVGDVTTLKTTSKTLVGAINELYDLINS